MITIETDFMTKAGHIIKVEVIIEMIKTSDVGSTLKMIGADVNIEEVIGGTVRVERGH